MYVLPKLTQSYQTVDALQVVLSQILVHSDLYVCIQISFASLPNSWCLACRAFWDLSTFRSIYVYTNLISIVNTIYNLYMNVSQYNYRVANPCSYKSFVIVKVVASGLLGLSGLSGRSAQQAALMWHIFRLHGKTRSLRVQVALTAYSLRNNLHIGCCEFVAALAAYLLHSKHNLIVVVVKEVGRFHLWIPIVNSPSIDKYGWPEGGGLLQPPGSGK